MVTTAFSLQTSRWPSWWSRPPGVVARVLSRWVARWMRTKHQRIQESARVVPDVPILVVGNVVLGGTGKTPVVADLVGALKVAGFNPGIVSRGFGRARSGGARSVTSDSDPTRVGDEPVMLAGQCHVPVVVAARRVDAIRQIVSDFSVDVVVCDDGLQHSGLGRDLSICVFNAKQGVGNAQVLPFGPLREPLDVVGDFDAVVVRQTDEPEAVLSAMGVMTHKPVFASTNGPLVVYRSDQPDRRIPLAALSGQHFQAVAGIANPELFFDSLESEGLQIERHAFSDHHPYTEDDMALLGEPVITTEKDAVKLVHLTPSTLWVVALRTEQSALNAWVIDQLTQWSSS